MIDWLFQSQSIVYYNWESHADFQDISMRWASGTGKDCTFWQMWIEFAQKRKNKMCPRYIQSFSPDIINNLN